jgi:hypothetical protein
MLNPERLAWSTGCCKTVPTMGAGWCPPGMLGIGIGGTAEKAVLLAKEVLMEDLDMYELAKASARPEQEARWRRCASNCYEKVNALGIGAQGSGRPDHGAGRQDQDVSHARREQAGGDDPQLRGDPPRALRARRLGPGLPRSALAGPVAEDRLGADYTQKSKRVDLNTLTQGRESPPGSRATPCC